MRKIALAVRDLRRAHPATKIILAYHDHFNEQHDPYHPLWLNDPCPAAKNVSILNNGQVFLCDFLAHIGDRFCGGSILEQPLMEIWSQAREFRLYRELPRAERCRNCDRLGTRCSGGCSAETLDHEDVFFDPLCFLRLDPTGTEAKASGNGLDAKSRFYDRDYFQRGPESGKGNYCDYRWQPEKTLSEVDALISLWNARLGQVVIDFGAAYGFYVKAFGMRGLKAYGIDCSRHAVEAAKKDAAIAERVFHSTSLTATGMGRADWVLAKDVLEHLTLAELARFMSEVKTLGAGLAVVVPLARFDGGRYLSPKAEKDGGHNLRRSRQWWLSLLQRHFGWVEEPNLPAAFTAGSNQGRIGLFIARPKPERVPARRKPLATASMEVRSALRAVEP
jgi:radical SAM protein with 4Fe4S-binding SPASM domain